MIPGATMETTMRVGRVTVFGLCGKEMAGSRSEKTWWFPVSLENTAPTAALILGKMSVMAYYSMGGESGEGCTK